MSAVLLVGSLLLGGIAIVWIATEFFGYAQKFIAPDNADRDAINRDLGEGTPEAQAELEKRFGPDSHWYDLRTGLVGLLGMVVLIWIWLG